MSVPPNTRVLVLNSDRYPLNSIGWKKAFKRTLVCVSCEHCKRGKIPETGMLCPYCNGKGKLPPAEVIEYYDIWIRDSAWREYAVPAVLCNRNHVKRYYKKVPFSRVNVFRRDSYICQFCMTKHHPTTLTLDHVVPRSMWVGPGTPTDWHNIVTACQKCNIKKNNRTPEQAGMPLQKLIDKKVVYYKRPKPATPTEIILGLAGGNYPPEWDIYVKHLLSSRNL